MKNLSPSFTLEECEFLIKYYTHLVIGKEVEKDVLIQSLEILPFDNGDNSVICIGKRNRQLDFKKDLCVVALRLNLIHPGELLQSLN